MSSEPIPTTTQYFTTDGIKKGVPFRNANGYSNPDLDALVDTARRQGKRRVELHAQRTAEPFYRRAGFVVLGAPYEEAGIAHITMVKDL